MENKEIYIDGVDVSGCENYIGANTKTHNCTLYDGYLRPCKNADCYYKNWQRKEQECEELKRYKSLFEKARDLWNEASRQKNKLLDENKDLKDSLKRTICQSECYRYKEAEKLKATLTEIKEIAENFCSESCPYKDDECDICVEDCLLDEIVNPILQKISEVLE